MTDKPELELLVEIAKLLRKYGPQAFEDLSSALSSPEFSRCLASVLSGTARQARSLRPEGYDASDRKQRSRDFRSSLVSLEEIDPEKSELLVKFYDDLMAQTVLPSLRDIRAFASDAGLPPAKATARNKAMVPLLKTLLHLSTDELRSKLSAVKRVSTTDDRSLEGWSSIILNKDRRSREGD